MSRPSLPKVKIEKTENGLKAIFPDGHVLERTYKGYYKLVEEVRVIIKNENLNFSVLIDDSVKRKNVVETIIEKSEESKSSITKFF